MLNLSRKHPFSFLMLALLWIAAALISGCSVESGPKGFEQPQSPTAGPTSESGIKLTKAFETTARDGKKFYFSGWSGTKIQKRSNGYYVTGTYDRDKGYTLDARIFGEPFRYYRWGNDVYISEQEKWRKIEPSKAPLEPFVDFSKLQFLADRAVRDKDGDILGIKCEQYQLSLNYEKAVLVANLMGAKLTTGDQSLSGPYFKQTKMKLYFWVGKSDNFIYKFMAVTNMPIPNAGSIYQETSFKFWKYNNPGINLPGPQKLAPYLIN